MSDMEEKTNGAGFSVPVELLRGPHATSEAFRLSLMDGFDMVCGDADDPFRAVLAVAIGAGSMCWSDVDKAGEFQSRRASQIVCSVAEYISQAVRDGRMAL